MAVGLLLVQAFDRAAIYADAAVDAGKGITGPGGGFFFNADALGRALGGTNAAKGAFFKVIEQFSPLVFKGRTDFIRVTPGGFFVNEISQNIGGHFKHGSFLLYLSVQLMHGSIDKTMTGTSDSHCPGSIVNSAGMLANVGVRIRSLARFLVPSALI
jgi:hypothetical protein